MEWLANNWGSVAGGVGILLSVVGVYLTVKSWKRKIPTYVIRSNNVFKGLEKTIPDIEVKFPGYGPPVTSITITKIGFWNAGNETIKKTDVVKDDPITIRAKEGVVFLSAVVVESVNPLNKFDCTVSKDRSSVAIAFDYLDCNQGALIQVFHTGIANADITMTGTVMGAAKIKRFRSANPDQPGMPLWAIAVMLSLAWTLLILLATGIVAQIFPDERPIRENNAIMSVETAFCFLGAATLVVGFFYYLTYLPKPFSKVHEK